MTIEVRRARRDDADFLLGLITDEDTRPFLGGRAGETHDEVIAEHVKIDPANASAVAEVRGITTSKMMLEGRCLLT